MTRSAPGVVPRCATSVRQAAAGELQEHVFQTCPANQCTLRLEAACVRFGECGFAVACVDQHTIGQQLLALTDAAQLRRVSLVAARGESQL